jgi:hypothetical protein
MKLLLPLLFLVGCDDKQFTFMANIENVYHEVESRCPGGVKNVHVEGGLRSCGDNGCETIEPSKITATCMTWWERLR